MSTSVAASADSASTSRAGRLRRLSQLRTYTQSHLIPTASSPTSPTSPTSSTSTGTRRHRNSLSRVVALSSPFHFSSSSPPSDPQAAALPPASSPPAARDSSLSSNSELHDHILTGSSESSQSIPSHAPADLGTQTAPRVDVVAPAPNNDQPSGSESAVNSDADSATAKSKMNNTIRFFPYQDPHQTSRPSLQFSSMSRNLPSEESVIRVGRYSERDGVPVANPVEPSDAPIGFKSKVVSRRHCEFSFVDGQWHLKDVGSSSGTFLNRIRLSPPNKASRLYAVRDGDIVQLGIDFRGGEEMIFRCVRIRVECNRTWQQRPNEFNKNTENLINNLGKGKAAADFAGCRECSICLGSVLRPYQCLFMAACAHVWHYKCISRLIHSRDYPMFQCPNCRVWTDLNAEVDDTVDFEDDSKHNGEMEVEQTASADNGSPTTGQSDPVAEHPANGAVVGDTELVAIVENMDLEDRNTPMQDAENPDSTEASADSTTQKQSTSRSANIPIPSSPRHGQSDSRSHTPADTENFEDNPMTPRNDTGPLALDGRAGRI
ncbi:hypothetical protein BGW36DRAFT_367409 [Talaromyces proteolyticus]|uniref:FHA domain protein n=1 Tax=Talaromyces proteolyticus TaxID=1131652 RepID=A0AAD4L2C9_9EURO|nr:uncharacterized protein BGW36DRAFT_367409 [Talaromyces proteolyticus]KAH8705351.1 hypothetical protein BGW36DRAFT_367409 [Talaromyces proteolyticus]